jgi:hypothetical protein
MLFEVSVLINSFSTSFESSMNKDSDLGIDWRRPFLNMHIYHIPNDLEGPLSARVAHDQYTTILEKCHVVHNRLFSQNARKPPVRIG